MLWIVNSWFVFGFRGFSGGRGGGRRGVGGLEGLFVPKALKKAHRVALCAFASFRSLLARVVKRRWQLRLRTLAPAFPAGLFIGAYAGAARVHNPGFPRGVTVYAVHGLPSAKSELRGGTPTAAQLPPLTDGLYRICGRLLQNCVPLRLAIHFPNQNRQAYPSQRGGYLSFESSIFWQAPNPAGSAER